MAIKASSLKPGHPVYTWIADTGENINIDSGALRNWCVHHKRLQPVLVNIDRDLAASFLRDNVVDPMRCMQLFIECEAGVRKLDPVIFALMQKSELDRRGIAYGGGNTPDGLLVDGHHRYAMTAMVKGTVIPAFILTVHQWAKFRVIDDTGGRFKQFTKEQLRDLPITPRDY